MQTEHHCSDVTQPPNRPNLAKIETLGSVLLRVYLKQLHFVKYYQTGAIDYE